MEITRVCSAVCFCYHLLQIGLRRSFPARSHLGAECQERFRLFYAQQWSVLPRRRTLRGKKYAAQDLLGQLGALTALPLTLSLCGAPSTHRQNSEIGQWNALSYVVKRRPTTLHGLASGSSLPASHFLTLWHFQSKVLPSGLLEIVYLRAFACDPCVGSVIVVGTDCCGFADLWFILWWDLGTVGFIGALCRKGGQCKPWRQFFASVSVTCA